MNSKQTLNTPLLGNQNDEVQEPAVAAVAEVVVVPSIQVQVRAPFDLQAGYQLTVDINGQAAVVAVVRDGWRPCSLVLASLVFPLLKWFLVGYSVCKACETHTRSDI